MELTIKTKYNLLDEVWIVWNNKPIKMIVKGADIRIYANDPSTMYIQYYLNNNSNLSTFKDECECFESKKELDKHYIYIYQDE